MSKNIEEQGLMQKLEKPHQKTYLTTPIGRFVERASYVDLFVFGSIVIFLSALYFWLVPKSNSLNKENIDILDALYFSIVTFTSLGYGDLSPVGFGRFVAIIVVILGLIFIALLVGKFASERQQTILLLLHTSDCQRRISDFSFEINQVCELLINKNCLEKNLKLATNSVEIIAKYLIFNAHQARLISFGNESALATLYKEISNLQKACIEIYKAEDSNLVISGRSLALVKRCHNIVRQLVFLHNNSAEHKSYTEILLNYLAISFKSNKVKPLSGSLGNINRTYEKMNLNLQSLERWSLGKATPVIINDVYNNVPIGPNESWPVNMNKEIAKKLNISNSLVGKCVSILIEKKKLPKKE